MQIVIPARFNGPPESGNGGVSCGVLAACYGENATVEVTLRQPPPLDTEMEVVDGPGGVFDAVVDGRLVMAAALVDDELQPVPPVDLAAARAAETRFPGWQDHPFPTCFVCGTQRPAKDGFGLHAGPVDPAVPTGLAAPWRAPDEPTSVDLWAAMDCPGGWSINIPGRPAVLGRMTARVDRLPTAGETCVVVAQFDGQDGRKSFSRTSVYDAAGALLATSKAVWIELR